MIVRLLVIPLTVNLKQIVGVCKLRTTKTSLAHNRVEPIC